MNKAILVLGAALVGCSDPLDSMSLEFGSDPLAADELREWSVTRLESGRHRITVRRAAEAADDCSDLRADLVRTGRQLTLRVLDPGSGEVAGAALTCGYTAVIHGVPTGRYNLRIVQGGPGHRSKSRLVMDQPLNLR